MALAAGGWYLLSRERPCEFEYRCEVSGENQLKVTVSVTNSWFSKGRTYEFPVTDQAVSWEEDAAAETSGSGASLYVGRGQTESLTYQVTLGQSGKHGAQGTAGESFCVFDGLHALLLPAEAYVEGIPSDEVLMSRLSVVLEVPEGWSAVNPFEQMEHVTWPDLYDLTNDCFAMGRFVTAELTSEEGGVLRVHTAENGWQPEEQDQEALLSLLDYYIGLFGIEKEYDVIFLPSDTAVIGGAGRHSVGASFDPEESRDWELLSHRMFHAFLDSRVRGQSIHQAPLLWLAEGLATYYENMALQSLPETVKNQFGWEKDRQLADLYDQYLYMRYKEPLLYQIEPEEEADLMSQAQVEFLHYIQAPLTVAWLEEETGEENAVLSDLLEHYDEGAYSVRDMTGRLLGSEEAERAWDAYFAGTEVLPLWQLGTVSREPEEILANLNEAEITLGSWLDDELGYYPIETMSLEGLETLKESGQLDRVSYADEETEEYISQYAETIDSLLRENCLRAELTGNEADDPMTRYEVLGNEEVAEAWKSWISGGCKTPFQIE